MQIMAWAFPHQTHHDDKQNTSCNAVVRLTCAVFLSIVLLSLCVKMQNAEKLRKRGMHARQQTSPEQANEGSIIFQELHEGRMRRPKHFFSL